jgi:hypothetical protein
MTAPQPLFTRRYAGWYPCGDNTVTTEPPASGTDVYRIRFACDAFPDAEMTLSVSMLKITSNHGGQRYGIGGQVTFSVRDWTVTCPYTLAYATEGIHNAIADAKILAEQVADPGKPRFPRPYGAEAGTSSARVLQMFADWDGKPFGQHAVSA